MRNLLCDEVIPHDWPRDELWEKRDIEPHDQHTALRLCLAVVDIKKIRQQLEREKRDANRQRDRDDREVTMQQETELRCHEGQVLKDKEQTDMEYDADCQYAPLGYRCLCSLNAQTDVPPPQQWTESSARQTPAHPRHKRPDWPAAGSNCGTAAT